MTNQPIEPFPADVGRDRFGDWLSGFTDGEGCFTLYSQRKGGSIVPLAAFKIALRIDDVDILRAIQSYWGCGRLHCHALKVSKPIAVYGIHRIKDLVGVVMPHFIRHPLRAKKARDFAIWREAVEFIWRVHKTPVTTIKRGVYKRWDASRRAAFDVFYQKLKAVRSFDATDAIMPPVESHIPSEPALFD